MALATGVQLGPYQIIEPIGAGGMGEVYRARDSRLGREVAIKVCHGDFSARFEREAQAIAQLNHPHICTLHDVGSNYLVMELVEGETLAARLKRGAMPLDQVIRYGAQIADAIASAHAKGIVHRDLKPGNVMSTKSGVKVLDFGLAKTACDDTRTLSTVAVGTPAYMAPEQRGGGEADARTDIYAIGLLLAEMATGKRGAPVLLPPAFRHVVERCLEEDPELRWQSARDLKAELEWAGESERSAKAAAPHWRARWAPAMAALGLIGIGAIGLVSLHRQPAAAPLASQFDLELALSQDDVGVGINTMPMPSPDGRSVLILGSNGHGGRMLWLRAIDSSAVRPLPGTEGAAGAIFWSPDGRWIGFYTGGKLKKISPDGGAPQTIATLPAAQEATWGAKGDIVFRPSNRDALYRIAESGGPVTQVTRLDASRTENSHRHPRFLPDGRRFLFTARCGQRENNSLFAGSLDTGKVKWLMPVDSQARYVPAKGGGGTGRLIYYLEGALVSRPFDLDREAVSGEPAPLFQGVAYSAASVTAYFSISDDGRVAVIRSGAGSQEQLQWFDRKGEAAGTLGPRWDVLQPRISPDGSRVAVTAPDPQTGNRDLFVIEVARGNVSRLTTHVANDWYPVWSPDGKQILFGSDREGGTDNSSFLKESLEPSAVETRFPGQAPTDWSRDGRWIVFGTSDLAIAPAAPGGKPITYLATPFQEGTGRFSPNGRWLAYTSNESGELNVYVRPFSGGPAPAEGKIQISTGGGDFPVWRRDGKELYYMDGGGAIFAVDTQALEQNRTAPHATRLFRACPGSSVRPLPVQEASYGQPYDTFDGSRFLITCGAEAPGRYTVLLNWPLGKS